MILVLRKMRHALLADNRLGKYLLYAFGEIVLVIIGILVALYINDLSDARKERVRELAYLQNIRTDLGLNIAEMDRYLASRAGKIASAQRILEHFNGKPVTDSAAFNADGVEIYSWKKFYLVNNTFQELVNSGQLAKIGNPRIKNQLLDIEALYTQMKSEEDHFRYDTEKLIYEPIYSFMDLQPLVASYEYRVTGGASGLDAILRPEAFDAYFKSVMLKNGFTMTILEFQTMNAQMQELKAKCQDLVAIIDEDIKAG